MESGRLLEESVLESSRHVLCVEMCRCTSVVLWRFWRKSMQILNTEILNFYSQIYKIYPVQLADFVSYLRPLSVSEVVSLFFHVSSLCFIVLFLSLKSLIELELIFMYIVS